MGGKWKQWQILFSWAPKITVDGDCSHEIKRLLLLGRKAMANLGSVLKSRDITLWSSPSNQSYGFSHSLVQVWELDHKEGWVLKKWCFLIVLQEKTLESPLDSREVKPANPNGNQPWIFIGRTDAEAPILWPPYAKSWLIGRDPDAGKDWGQEEKGASEDEMVWLDGITDSVDMNLSNTGRWWRTEKPGMLQSLWSQRVGQDLATEQQQLMNC